MRTSADITIHRIDGTTLPVPITPEARRTWRLMREDNIRLRWDSSTEYRAKVGDWIGDELFGKFYVTEEQEPTVDTATGAYRHDIRFDRDYIGWKNVLHMLTYDNGTSRKETDWTLTDSLQNHLNEVVKGLKALGYSCGDPVVESSVENPEVAVSVTFSGTSVYDALNALTGAYSCEWWVTYNGDYTVSTIHFGKCELADQPHVITLGDNAEDVTPSRGGDAMANRIFAFGSTRNIPETYRKTLSFQVTDTSERTYDGQTATVFRDSLRVVTSDMLKADESLSEGVNLSLGSLVYNDSSTTPPYREAATSSAAFTLAEAARYGAAGDISLTAKFTRNDDSEEDGAWSWLLSVDGMEIATGGGTLTGFIVGNTTITVNVSQAVSESVFLSAGQHTARLEIRTLNSHFYLSYAKADSANVTLTPSGYKVDCPLIYNGNTYTVRFNPLSEPSSRETFNWFSFVGSVPSGFGAGSRYTLGFSDGETSGLLPLKTPVSFYSDDMGDLSSLRMVGARRLMLPAPGYVESGDTSTGRVVEKVVIFENIFPKLYLQITDITEGTYTDNTEWSDGSRSYGSLPKYTIKVKRITESGLQDFNFKRAYLTSDPLRAVFVTYDEAHGPGSNRSKFLLSGMTFGLNFNEAAQTYTIAFNEDYGAKLPNGILKPNIGDALILTGWNVNAIESLGLVGDAEGDLLTAATTYLSAVSKPSFTWRCRMMSDSMMSDGLLNPGQSVRIVRGNLEDTTRVIGFEYKLDIPEDTPEYECGETEAYSRLRELEKALNARTVNTASASGGAVSATSSSAGSTSEGATLSAVLSWQTGAVDPATSDTFDGTADKILTIPSEIAHLSDGDAVPKIDEVLETKPDGTRVVRLVDGSGNTILPSGSLDWFIPETYEENGETRYRLKLNPKYVGMYAEGWVSSGGISDTPGGGGASYLRDLLDVDDNIDSTSNYGKYLYYDGTLGKWTASGTQVTEETVAGWGFTKNIGTVTGVKVGNTSYSPDNGVVSLPAYPTTLPASDVSAWAKKSSLAASDVPSLAISKISGLQSALDNKQPLDSDLTAIAALSGTSGLLRKANGTWGLDTASYATTSALNTALDGYLPLSGGTLTGNLFLTSGSSSIYVSGSNSSMLYGSTSTSGNIGNTIIGQAFGNTYLRGQNDPVYRKYNSVGNYQEYTMWHSGNANLPSVDWTARELTAATSLIIGTTTNAKASPMVWDETNNAWHLEGNLYADGFISAGGVSSEGGGSSSYLRDLLDVDDNIDSTSNYGKYLYYDGTLGKWTAKEASGSQGTVTSVALTVPTGLSVSGSPVTSSGTIAISLASGYSIPTTAKQTQWSTAYGWGDHSQAGYAMASALSGYLPLTGGTLTGNLFLTSGSASIYVSGSGGSMLYGSTSTFGNIGQTVIGQALGNTYLRGQNNPAYRKYDSVGNYQEYAMWHSGNDGAGSGLDADLLDGQHLAEILASNVASATKLETARTIWGQNFDGTGNVNGAFFFNAGDGTLKIYDVTSPTASLGKESVAIQTAFDQQNPETSGYPGAYEGRCLLLLQPRGGRVGIGTPNPSYKLDVNGSARIAGTLTSQAIQPSTTSTSQSTGYDLGASTAFWKNTYTRRIYLADGIYVYYDSTNQCIRTNAPIASDSWISAGGVSTT